MIQQQIYQLFEEQTKHWELARKNNEALSRLETRRFVIGNTEIKLQFNPARIVSSGATLDASAIQQRSCFLCENNRPEVQQSIDFNERFEILINPYPILPFHFTIPLKKHERQQISPYISDMLALSESMVDFVIFYNGPESGASAPDHMHFQAVKKGALPLEIDVFSHEHTRLLEQNNTVLYLLEDYLRTCYVIEGYENIDIEFLFFHIYNALKKDEHEPKMNIFCWTDECKKRLCIFPRKVHRPSQFYATDKNHLLISPGAIDMAGIFIIPHRKDFEAITEDIITDVFEQVSLNR